MTLGDRCRLTDPQAPNSSSDGSLGTPLDGLKHPPGVCHTLVSPLEGGPGPLIHEGDASHGRGSCVATQLLGWNIGTPVAFALLAWLFMRAGRAENRATP